LPEKSSESYTDPPAHDSLNTHQRIARLEAEIVSLTTALDQLRSRIELLEPDR
jgi:uncharacterized protein YceH (UPF0502 family)